MHISDILQRHSGNPSILKIYTSAYMLEDSINTAWSPLLLPCVCFCKLSAPHAQVWSSVWNGIPVTGSKWTLMMLWWAGSGGGPSSSSSTCQRAALFTAEIWPNRVSAADRFHIHHQARVTAPQTSSYNASLMSLKMLYVLMHCHSAEK